MDEKYSPLCTGILQQRSKVIYQYYWPLNTFLAQFSQDSFYFQGKTNTQRQKITFVGTPTSLMEKWKRIKIVQQVWK